MLVLYRPTKNLLVLIHALMPDYCVTFLVYSSCHARQVPYGDDRCFSIRLGPVSSRLCCLWVLPCLNRLLSVTLLRRDWFVFSEGCRDRFRLLTGSPKNYTRAKRRLSHYSMERRSRPCQACALDAGRRVCPRVNGSSSSVEPSGTGSPGGARRLLSVPSKQYGLSLGPVRLLVPT